MRITFCGTGGATLNRARAGAAIHVETNAARLLLDCGPGSLERYAEAGLGVGELDAVFLSHLHFDHAMGVSDLLTRWAFRLARLPQFYGPSGTAQYVESAAAFAREQQQQQSGGSRVKHLAAVEVEETYPDDERMFADAQIQSVEVPHVDYLQCLSRRVTANDVSLVYSGDTRPAPEVMVPQSEGAHVLVHEAFTEHAVELFVAKHPADRRERIAGLFHAVHSPAVEVGRLAQAAGVRTLILTHLMPDETEAALRDEAGQHFRGEIVVAHDGMSLAIGGA